MTVQSFGALASAALQSVTKRKSRADGTGDPVRKLSYDVDDRRANPWVRLGDGSIKQQHVWHDSLKLTLKELRQKQRREGYRGPDRLQANDLLVYESLLSRMDAATGRLYPELVTIAADAGVSKQTVVDALKRIASHGFISWVRRSKVSENKGQAGPQREQTSNAYFVDLAALRRKTRCAWFRIKALVARRLKGLGKAVTKLARQSIADEGLALAIAGLGRAVSERESRKQALPPRRE